MPKKVVILRCPNPDCNRTWMSSQGENCPKCTAHGYTNKGIPVKEKDE